MLIYVVVPGPIWILGIYKRIKPKGVKLNTFMGLTGMHVTEGTQKSLSQHQLAPQG